MFFVHDRKNVERVDAQLCAILYFTEHLVDGEAVDAWHAFHLYSLAGTLEQEKRENQVVRIHGGFFHHRPYDLTLAIAAGPRMIQAEGHFYKVSRVNLSVWPLRLIPVQYMLADKGIDFPQLRVIPEKFCMLAKNAHISATCRPCLSLLRTRFKALVERFSNEWFEPIRVQFLILHQFKSDGHHMVGEVRRENGSHMERQAPIGRDSRDRRTQCTSHSQQSLLSRGTASFHEYGDVFKIHLHPFRKGL